MFKIFNKEYGSKQFEDYILGIPQPQWGLSCLDVEIGDKSKAGLVIDKLIVTRHWGIYGCDVSVYLINRTGDDSGDFIYVSSSQIDYPKLRDAIAKQIADATIVAKDKIGEFLRID